MPPVKYNFLDADEAEQKFEERNKTLNYFSIMVSKKLKNSEEGEEGVGGAGVGGDKKEKVAKEKAKGAGSGLVSIQAHAHAHFKETVMVTSYPISQLLTDSDSGGFSSDNDSDGIVCLLFVCFCYYLGPVGLRF